MLKNLDLISDMNSIYFKGRKNHPNKFAGILSVISYLCERQEQCEDKWIDKGIFRKEEQYWVALNRFFSIEFKLLLILIFL